MGGGTVLPNGVKVAESDQYKKCQKLTKVGLVIYMWKKLVLVKGRGQKVS